jgi:hypothetical protein
MPFDRNNPPKLDRLPNTPDQRDYEMRPILRALTVPVPNKSREWAGPYVRLDQGREGACVGFAITNELMGSPVRVRPPGYDAARKLKVSNAFAQHLYEVARRDYDEWPGEDYDGTSVRAGLRAAKAAGYIAEFRAVRTPEELRQTLYFAGPVVVGIDWTEAMFDYDEHGVVRRGGDVVGGHALCINALYPSRYYRPAYRARQSWGGTYGIGGDVWFDADHLHDLLFNRGGDCMVPLGESYGPLTAFPSL